MQVRKVYWSEQQAPVSPHLEIHFSALRIDTHFVLCSCWKEWQFGRERCVGPLRRANKEKKI